MVRQRLESLPHKGTPVSAYEKALKQALAERAEIVEGRDHATQRISELTAVAQSLLPLVPPERRARYAKELEAESVPLSGRAAPAFRNVVHLCTTHHGREWTAPQMQQALLKCGVETEIKPIHNALNYLAREGRIRRISRGRYYVPEYGFGIETSDDLLGEGE